eukprot:GSChrysophyteH1.ASY1.ANO1.3002.1 assembled CDS
MPPIWTSVQRADGTFVKEVPPDATKEEVGKRHDSGSAEDGKDQESFRDYSALDSNSQVARFYKQNHELQTLSHVTRMKEKYYNFNKAEYTIMELFEASDQIVDESDPDLHLSQLHHAIQTAERARKLHPEPHYDWFWFTAFIHDLGKILALFGEEQWTVVGDTFPVGCAFDKTNIYHEYFADNTDRSNDAFSTACGIYEANCGFDQVCFSFGHDDYLATCLEHNNCSKLPYESLYCIRYHSFYPWHKYGGYNHLASSKDIELRSLLQDFQKCDLYSKDDTAEVLSSENYKELEGFYTNLADKFIGLDTKLRF